VPLQPADSGGVRRCVDATGGSKTITIGFLTDLTGVASSGFLTSKLGIDAFVNRVNAAGGVNG
jgi:branched-chain amino acid transport system substrate-binding protein